MGSLLIPVAMFSMVTQAVSYVDDGCSSISVTFLVQNKTLFLDQISGINTTSRSRVSLSDIKALSIVAHTSYLTPLVIYLCTWTSYRSLRTSVSSCNSY